MDLGIDNPDHISVRCLDFVGLDSGADGETRTPTPVKALAPEASVSTNSTTSACCHF